MSVPTPYTLQIVPFAVETGVDSLGNPVTTWADPVPWRVHSWHHGSSDEAVVQGREPSAVAVTVYAPTAPLSGHDRVVIGSDSFAVIGDPRDWTHGPWAHPQAGFEVQLKRWEG